MSDAPNLPPPPPPAPSLSRAASPAPAGLDRAVFFGHVRRSNFEGRLKAGQVEGLNKTLDYRDAHWPRMIDEELAYVLATFQWESGHSMQCIEEGWPMSGERLKAYQRKLRYFPWHGRGPPQLTFETNYIKFGVADQPDALLAFDTGLRVLFEGMIYGRFRGAKLADFISPARQDYVGARNIVNGRRKGEALPDKAREIAALAEDYLAALRAARASDFAHPASDAVKAAQQELQRLRYQLGRVDGVVGEATVGALAMFQFTNALPVTGQLDEATLALLQSGGGCPSELASAREQDAPDTLEGSRTIAATKKAETSAYGLIGVAIAWSAAHPQGVKLLLAMGGLFLLTRIVSGVREAAAARLDDHKSGANLGR
ncbi:MAG: peptidoglycan-binding domain-containing protein [Methylocystis sp.]